MFLLISWLNSQLGCDMAFPNIEIPFPLTCPAKSWAYGVKIFNLFSLVSKHSPMNVIFLWKWTLCSQKSCREVAHCVQSLSRFSLCLEPSTTRLLCFILWRCLFPLKVGSCYQSFLNSRPAWLTSIHLQNQDELIFMILEVRYYKQRKNNSTLITSTNKIKEDF